MFLANTASSTCWVQDTHWRGPLKPISRPVACLCSRRISAVPYRLREIPCPSTTSVYLDGGVPTESRGTYADLQRFSGNNSDPEAGGRGAAEDEVCDVARRRNATMATPTTTAHAT